MRALHSSGLVLDHAHIETPLRDLQRALDLDSLWQASRTLLTRLLPQHSCSLMLDISGYQPRAARHYVAETRRAGYMPATSLTVSRPYLENHREVEFYTYSQIVSEDPSAANRRVAQESGPVEWTDFVHMAFWRDREPQAVLSIRRTPAHPTFTEDELRVLRQIYPIVEAGVHRIQELEAERVKNFGCEHFLQALSVPVMVLDRDGRTLFATREAREMCARWNQLGRTWRMLGAHEVEELPQEIAANLQTNVPAEGSASCAADGVPPTHRQIRHPSQPGFAANVEVCWAPNLAWPRPYYLVTFAYATGAKIRTRQHSPSAFVVLQQLTPCERNVALLVVEGLRNREIAARLSRSLRTIEFHLNSIYTKLDISSRTQLIKLLT
jgi:DNA-binding CsgD family transcriptional regulator